MGSVSQNPVPKKQPRPQLAERMDISPISANMIERRVAELAASGVKIEYSRILARELGAPE